MSFSRPSKIIKVLFVIACIASLLHGLQRGLPDDGALLDFGSFWDSGRAAIEGRNPYTWGQHTFFVRINEKFLFNYNLNPPASLLLFGPMSFIDPDMGYILNYGCSLVLFFVVARFVSRSIAEDNGGLFLLWAMSLPFFWDTLKLGQIYIYLAALSVLAYLHTHKERYATGSIFWGALLAIKPNFGAILLFVPSVYWRRIAIPAVLVFLLCNLLALAIFDAETYMRWYAAATSDLARLAFPSNVSLSGTLSRLTDTSAYLHLNGILLVVSIALAYYLTRNIRQLEVRIKVGYLVAILASPIGWVHYLLIAFPVFMGFKVDNLGVLIMTLYLAPIYAVVGYHYNPTFINAAMSLYYPAATLLLVYKVLRDHKKSIA